VSLIFLKYFLQSRRNIEFNFHYPFVGQIYPHGIVLRLRKIFFTTRHWRYIKLQRSRRNASVSTRSFEVVFAGLRVLNGFTWS